AFGLGVALGASPGPVQLLLFSEASRGGAGRGLRAMAGANATFGLMMLLLAAGLSSLEPGETFLRVVKVIGGAFLVFLAVDAIREGRRPQVVEDPRGGLHPSVRGIVALLLDVSLMDSAMVLLGAGAHRVSERFLRILGDVLAVAMGMLGVWLIVR